MDYKSRVAAKLQPPFNPEEHKPYEEMTYADRVAMWRIYGFYQQLSNQTRVITNKAAAKYVGEQVDLIRDLFITKFTADDLTDPRYL